MGRDKALLPVPGEPALKFVTHLARLLAAHCQEVLLVSRDQAQAHDYLSYLPPSIRVITDLVPQVGPLMGLYSGLCAMHTSHALVTAVDMPFLQPALLNFLLSQAQPATITMPLVAGQEQVLLAIYPRSILPLIEQRLQEGRRDPRSLLQLARVQLLEEAQLRTVDPQLRSFININTPEEFSFYR
ncbi:putative molybdenum cofactor guanylyltransferase [Dictyobacter formicarum]|uniref:Molybdenum cofactor guanylyltransferase n=2 Tax=Dictyobacter formicarum TaxID=2778368 RepID=A0ABQ3VPW3_9CHLR|nr:putative molybdenum cofactor guanylyltransferase [Dictyobacter formicarum]